MQARCPLCPHSKRHVMRPFKIEVPQEQLDDLLKRLSHTRLPGSIFQSDDQDGTSLPFMRKLLEYWQDGFDWRVQEERLNKMPQFTAEVMGSTIHYVHKKGNGPSAVPLVLTHGWPGSFIEFEALVEQLTDPGRFGGDPLDAFDV